MPLAFVLARRRFRGSALVEAVIDLPIVLPPSVAGLALLLLLGRRGLLGEPWRRSGSSSRSRPRPSCSPRPSSRRRSSSARPAPGFAGVDRDLEDAARVDGAVGARSSSGRSPSPLASAALAAGLVMCWARSLGEFGATIMFAGNVQGQTRPCRSSSTASSRAATSTARSRPPRSSSSRRSASSSPSGRCTGRGRSTSGAARSPYRRLTRAATTTTEPRRVSD